MNGIITNFNQNDRCKRCDRTMASSEYKNIKLAYLPPQRPKPICIKCAIFSKSSKKWIEIDEVDKFVNGVKNVK